MRILLVRPYPELHVAKCLEEGFLHLEPLDLEIVAGGVPFEDSVSILDLGLERKPDETLKSCLLRDRTDIVGFTGYSSHARLLRRLAGLTKRTSPSSTVIVGGIHATIAPHDYACPDIDLVVRGEGGSAIREIIRRHKAGEPLPFSDIAFSPSDPAFREQVSCPPPAYPLIENVPAPRRDLVNRSRYFCVWSSSTTSRLESMFPRVASVRTSVGCAFNCSFCVVPFMMHRKYVQRDPVSVVDEIMALKEKYVYFVDDEMFLNPQRVQRIAELLLERGIKKHYTSWTRSDTIVRHPEIFRMWKEVGLSTLYVGIEAMDDTQLDSYNKKTDAGINREAVRILREIGITLHASFLVDPDFTVEKFRRLEKDVMDVCPAEVTFTVMSPPPGTALWHESRDAFVCDPFYFYDCMHSILKTALPLRKFYAHFSRLMALGLRANPLRVNRVRVPFLDLCRAIYVGTRYIFALRSIYKDYDGHEYCSDNQ